MVLTRNSTAPPLPPRPRVLNIGWLDVLQVGKNRLPLTDNKLIEEVSSAEWSSSKLALHGIAGTSSAAQGEWRAAQRRWAARNDLAGSRQHWQPRGGAWSHPECGSAISLASG